MDTYSFGTLRIEVGSHGCGIPNAMAESIGAASHAWVLDFRKQPTCDTFGTSVQAWLPIVAMSTPRPSWCDHQRDSTVISDSSGRGGEAGSTHVTRRACESVRGPLGRSGPWEMGPVPQGAIGKRCLQGADWSRPMSVQEAHVGGFRRILHTRIVNCAATPRQDEPEIACEWVESTICIPRV